MSLCSYPTNWLVSTIAPDHHACILQLHMTISHVFMRRILSSCMSVTVSSYQHPCLLHLHRPSAMSVTIATCHFPCIYQLHLTSSHISLQTCAYKHVGLTHLHRTSIHICYSNIQPSVLSLALVMVVTIALGKQACTNQQSSW